MSYRSYSFRGIGFDLERVEKEDIFAFFKKHEHSLPDDVREAIMDVVNDEDSDLYDLQCLSDVACVSEFVADVMNAETGCEFDFMEGDCCEDAVIFPPRYPWEHQCERAVTREELIAIMNSYAGEFGLVVDTNMDIEC